MRLPRQQQKPNQIAERIHQGDDLCRLPNRASAQWPDAEAPFDPVAFWWTPTIVPSMRVYLGSGLHSPLWKDPRIHQTWPTGETAGTGCSNGQRQVADRATANRHKIACRNRRLSFAVAPASLNLPERCDPSRCHKTSDTTNRCSCIQTSILEVWLRNRTQ